MAESNSKLKSQVEAYLADVRRIRASGGATGERSYYTPLANLLNAIGDTLKPKVFCIGDSLSKGQGIPTSASTQLGKCSEGVLAMASCLSMVWLLALGVVANQMWTPRP